jgi:iron complex outermembrane receptor protein
MKRVFTASGRIVVGAVLLLAVICGSRIANAQRSSEDAVAQAADAFGMTVGREAIGLYSAGNARGFSPTQAGNLRIDGLYFDQVANGLVTRIVRSQTVHVGIAAQGYLFPAPTGVVDYQLRTPGNETLVSELIGDASYGQAYSETDAQVSIIPDVLSMGGGIGFTRNVGYDFAPRSYEVDEGWIARFQPNDSLVITPFWGMMNRRVFGERALLFVDHSGYPKYRSDILPYPPWADWGYLWQNFGATAHYGFGSGWQLDAGLFRSLAYSFGNDNALLLNTNALDQAQYVFVKAPPNSSGSTSGEVRLTKRFDTGPIHNAIYAHVTGRDSSIESGGARTGVLGAATTTYLPPLPRPSLTGGQNTNVIVHQWTPGLGYAASWTGHAQLTLGLQRVLYERTVRAPLSPTVSDKSSIWVGNVSGAVSPIDPLLFYASYTRGFEEIGIAPVNAANPNQPVPAQRDTQVDAGIRYRLLPKLQLVAGVFEITKPYFNLDQSRVFRLVGTTRNRGAEFSLTGNLTEQLNVVAGLVLIHPQVQYQAGTVTGPTNVVAIGPIPGYMSTYVQYHPAALPKWIFGATAQSYSSMYAVYPDVNLPSVTTLGADVRYKTQLWGRNATFWLEGYNLNNAYVITPSASGQLNSLDARRFELSLVVDL